MYTANSILGSSSTVILVIIPIKIKIILHTWAKFLFLIAPMPAPLLIVVLDLSQPNKGLVSVPHSRQNLRCIE